MNGTADAIVVPYFHMLCARHLWPCVDETTAALTAGEAEKFRAIPGFVCPSVRKAELAAFVDAARTVPAVDFVDSYLFAVIRLRPELKRVPVRRR